MLGHSDPFKYTPKQLHAFSVLGLRRRKSELLEILSMTRAAYHAKKEDLKKVMKELQRG